ncbi:hypothetical protein C2S53_011112 [Perilla frutescens var. hirtella]|uniref:Uncharacterized protein n=1 Tax=Perilla frutescens var. hirtella TaxID=608512 RepID=A0AAD4ISZ0_PERFH|nr:hypothetical protein C2S53_011112 [Perilla frutescens var. hirtella]
MISHFLSILHVGYLCLSRVHRLGSRLVVSAALTPDFDKYGGSNLYRPFLLQISASDTQTATLLVVVHDSSNIDQIRQAAALRASSPAEDNYGQILAVEQKRRSSSPASRTIATNSSDS